MKEEMLLKFCSSDKTRDISKPFNVDSHTYATDGHIGIRVTVNEQYSQNKVRDGVVESVKALPFGKVDGLDYVDVPKEEILFTNERACGSCGGTGKIQECPDCGGCGEVSWTSPNGYEYEVDCLMCDDHKDKKGGPCDDCGETGKKRSFKYVEIGCLFSGGLLYRIGILPGCKIAVMDKENLKPVPFIFEGGDGIIMPCRRFEEWGTSEARVY